MATALSDVYDMFMQTCADYRLVSLLDTSETAFEDYVEAWLKFSIVEFSPICDQSLSYDPNAKTFSATLTLENVVVLATLMMKYWLQKNINDITQMNLHIGDRDFKVPSEASNLREKRVAFIHVQEQCSQLLQDYAYKRNPWTNWFAQDFAGG